MRFVELRSSATGTAFHLHRRITWLRGLDPAARVSVVGLAHDVALGENPDWHGTAEIANVEMSLADAVSQMGETGDSALVIDAASLPLPQPVDSSVDQGASAELAEAHARVQELNDTIRALHDELAEASSSRAELTASLKGATARIDDAAWLALDAADGALVRAARLAERPDPWSGMDDVPARIDELEKLVAELDEALGWLVSGDRPALAAAMATARASISEGPVPHPEATALAQAWVSLHQRLHGLESRMEASGSGTETVATRLENARAGALSAETSAVPRPITAEESALLEELHEVMLAAETKAARGVRRGAGRAAFERANEALQEALEPLGYPTWAAYRMGNGMASVSDELLVAHARATTELDAAETEWAELMARLEGDSELQDVLAAIERALEHAHELLGAGAELEGDPDAVTAALQALTIDASAVGVNADVAMGHLREALDATGATGHEDLTSDAAVVALGDSWLGVLQAADEAAVRILRERERASEELAALVEIGDGQPADSLAPLRDAVRSSEAKATDVRMALVTVVESRLQLHRLAAREVNLAEQHDDRLSQRESAEAAADSASRRAGGSLDSAADEFAAQVPRGVGGPIPVVVVMGASPAATLDRLAVLPDDVQILVVGEGEGIDEWLAAVGPDVASAIDAAALV